MLILVFFNNILLYIAQNKQRTIVTWVIFIYVNCHMCRLLFKKFKMGDFGLQYDFNYHLEQIEDVETVDWDVLAHILY